MRIFIAGLKYPDAFAERTAPSLLVDVACVESSDEAGVTLLPDPCIPDLASDTTMAWLMSVVESALHASGQDLGNVLVTFQDGGMGSNNSFKPNPLRGSA